MKTVELSSVQLKNNEKYMVAIRKHFLRLEISTRKCKYLKFNKTFKTQKSNIHIQDINGCQ